MTKVKRINLDDPAQRAEFIKSGGIWKFPQYWQVAIDAINKGEVPLAECKDIPAAAKGALN